MVVGVVALSACNDPATEARMRGNVHMRAGEVGQALEAYQESVRLLPDRGHGHQLLANALQELGRPAEAEASYRKAIELVHPSSQVGIDSRRELAILLFHGGKPSASKDLLREVLTHRSDDVFALNRLAEVHAALGEPSEAGALIEAVLQRDPGNLNARLTQIRIASAANRWDEAVASLAALRKLRPAEPFVDYEMAVIQAGKGDVAAAVRALKTALAGADAAARAKTKSDPRLASLAGDPGFLALVAPPQ